MFTIQIRVDQNSSPAEFEVVANFKTAPEVTAWLCNSHHRPLYVGRDVRIVHEDQVWDSEEWLYSRPATELMSDARLPG